MKNIAKIKLCPNASIQMVIIKTEINANKMNSISISLCLHLLFCLNEGQIARAVFKALTAKMLCESKYLRMRFLFPMYTKMT